uniref:Transmembrane protein 70 n=1 Tax=Mastacembelus armatus TaxID=205130 RepID=A0A3Q3LRP7_9TELE
MFSVLILCRLRPCAGPRLFKYRHITAPLPVSCLRGDRGKELHDDRRSLLNTGHKTHCLSNRPLSTAPHSEDGKLIYSGSLGSAVRGVKMFSYSTSTASLILMPHILLNTGIGVQSFAMQVAFCGVIGFFTFLTPVLLHLITKGYVIRLYHNPDKDTYAAVTYSVFLTEKKNVFHQSQVKIPAVSCSPLHLAACWGHLETVRTLLELEADIKAKTFRGERPVDMARRYSKTDCVNCLIMAGVGG